MLVEFSMVNPPPQIPKIPNSKKKHAVKDSDEDKELGYVGETLSSDKDAIMKPVDSGSKNVGTGSTWDLIELSNAEEAEEDEGGETSELAVISF